MTGSRVKNRLIVPPNAVQLAAIRERSRNEAPVPPPEKRVRGHVLPPHPRRTSPDDPPPAEQPRGLARLEHREGDNLVRQRPINPFDPAEQAAAGRADGRIFHQRAVRLPVTPPDQHTISDTNRVVDERWYQLRRNNLYAQVHVAEDIPVLDISSYTSRFGGITEYTGLSGQNRVDYM